MVHSKINELLRTTSIIVANKRVEDEIRGEKFNIFSILKFETKENEVHSAFIGELLNPFGTHLKGNVFLKLFLEIVESVSLDWSSARVALEKSIGPINIDYDKPSNSSGGRIDIFIEDSKGESISIENKIFAQDQLHQIIRYHNYKKSNNTVYYLTLNGTPPNGESHLSLEPGKDFFEITYEHHILKWLTKCHEYSSDNPILRESIKQYLILIKNMTGQMENRQKDELQNLILSNFEAADTIARNLNEARKKVCAEIHDLVFERLNNLFADNKYLKVEKGIDVWHKHSPIWIIPMNQKNRELYFFLESFSGDGHFNGRMFIGILNPPPHNSGYAVPPNNMTLSNWVINKSFFNDFNGYKINLSDRKTIHKLYNDGEFKTMFIDHIIREAETYINDEFPSLKKFLETGEIPNRKHV